MARDTASRAEGQDLVQTPLGLKEDDSKKSLKNASGIERGINEGAF